MELLNLFKALLGNPNDDDVILQFYLDTAKAIICDIRNTNYVESKYTQTQLKIAIELYNKRGAEGELQHKENGIDRVYEKADVSPSLLSNITPIAKTPFTKVRTNDANA